MILRQVLSKSVLILCCALVFNACSKPINESSNSSEPVSISPAQSGQPPVASDVSSNNSSLESAFEHKQSDIQVSGHGKVVKLLSDDTNGARHQKFLVKINPRQILLFAHNIDLAAKIPLQVGDEISFKGEYVYNPKGGIIHWTHLDPHGHHPSGWIMLNGNKYQ